MRAADMAGLTVIGALPSLGAAAIEYAVSGANPLAGDTQTVLFFGMPLPSMTSLTPLL